jgi:hypothetical protein
MLREVFSQTGANSRVLETDGEDMQNREHSCFFSAAHAAKDSGIALELTRNLGLDLPLSRATKEQYDRMIAEGLGELDKSGIAELTFKDPHKHPRSRLVHAQSAKTHALLSGRRECDRNARAERQLSIANHSRRPQLYSRHSQAVGL